MVGLPGSVVSPMIPKEPGPEQAPNHSAGLALIHSNYGRTWQMVGVSWHFFLYMPFATQP